MPTIRVDMYEGRTPDQKRALAQALTEACVHALGSAPESVTVMMYDVPKHNWAKAGVLASDPKPGG